MTKHEEELAQTLADVKKWWEEAHDSGRLDELRAQWEMEARLKRQKAEAEGEDWDFYSQNEPKEKSFIEKHPILTGLIVGAILNRDR